jgi:hypothetical protein
MSVPTANSLLTLIAARQGCPPVTGQFYAAVPAGMSSADFRDDLESQDRHLRRLIVGRRCRKVSTGGAIA